MNILKKIVVLIVFLLFFKKPERTCESNIFTKEDFPDPDSAEKIYSIKL